MQLQIIMIQFISLNIVQVKKKHLNYLKMVIMNYNMMKNVKN